MSELADQPMVETTADIAYAKGWREACEAMHKELRGRPGETVIRSLRARVALLRDQGPPE